MNSRLRCRSLTSAWTLPVTRSMPASKLTVPWRLYSCSRAKVKIGVALFQVVSHFVRLHLFLVQDLAHRALRQIGQACMSLLRSTLASVAGEEPGRPQLV